MASDFFKLRENKTDVKTEILAGLTTFMTMAYILAVNPSILGEAGMPQGEVFTATALAAVIGTVLMALLANYPFALAPGMGLNAFLTYTVVFGMGKSWQLALLAVFLEGIIFIILTVVPVREAIFNAIPKNLKQGIAAGIGLFIAFIGLQNAGIVVPSASTGVSLGAITSAGPALCIIGVIIIAVLNHKKVKGALLIGILATWVLGMLAQLVGWYHVDVEAGVYSLYPSGIISMPSGLGTIGAGCFNFKVITEGMTTAEFIGDLLIVMFSFMFVDIFDTLGTLIGVASKADMLDEEGRLPRLKPALLSDAVATAAGAVLGTSTTTTYVESASGVAAGGRTGLTALSTACLFLIALFFSPIFLAIPSFATATALIFVGFLMIESILHVDFTDATEAVPAYLAAIFMPFAYSISEGIAIGFISYTLINALTGKAKKVSPVMWIVSIIFLLYYIIVK